MSIRIVRLGSDRQPGEGLRIGAVRHLPRGVRKSEYAERNFFDVWLPNLSPSAESIHELKSAEITEARWRKFAKQYAAEMQGPETKHILEFLVRLSKTTNLSAGCYCEDESRCHLSVLRELLIKAGADIVT